MPVKNPGSYPTSSDVFYSPNIFINGVNVALYNSPSKGPASPSGSSSDSSVNAQQDQNVDASSTAITSEQQSTSTAAPTLTTPLPPPVVPPNSGLSGQATSDTTVVVPSQTPEANVNLSQETLATYSATVASYVANPDSFRMQLTNALSGNIKSCFPGTLRNLSLFN